MRRTMPGTRAVFATNIFDKRNPTGEYLTDPTSALYTNVFVEDPRVVGCFGRRELVGRTGHERTGAPVSGALFLCAERQTTRSVNSSGNEVRLTAPRRCYIH